MDLRPKRCSCSTMFRNFGTFWKAGTFGKTCDTFTNWFLAGGLKEFLHRKRCGFHDDAHWPAHVYFVDFKSIVFPLWGAVGYVTTVIGYRGYIPTFGVNYHGYTCQLPQLQPHSTDAKPSPHIQLVGWVMAQIPADYQLYHFKSGAGRCQGGNGAWMRLQWWKLSNERRSASQLTRCCEHIDVFWMTDQPDVCMEWFPDGFNSILWMFGVKIGTGKNFPFCWISNYT